GAATFYSSLSHDQRRAFPELMRASVAAQFRPDGESTYRLDDGQVVRRSNASAASALAEVFQGRSAAFLVRQIAWRSILLAIAGSVIGTTLATRASRTRFGRRTDRGPILHDRESELRSSRNFRRFACLATGCIVAFAIRGPTRLSAAIQYFGAWVASRGAPFSDWLS